MPDYTHHTRRLEARIKVLEKAMGLTGGQLFDVPTHIHDDRYFRENEFIAKSTGSADAGKPVKTALGTGILDPSMIPQVVFVNSIYFHMT